MAATAEAYIARGMNPIQAGALAAQVEGTPSVRALIGLGFPVPMANELFTQMTAGVGNRANLTALGMPAALAVLVAADIEATEPQ